MNRTLQIDIWSDIACPWCYVGKRHFEAALADFPEREAVRIRWRAFELDPEAPATRDPVDYVERLARKYRTSAAEAQAMIDRMTGVAKGVGLDFHFERIQPGNTFDAHRLLHLAGERGVQGALKERLLKAYLCEGEAIGDPEALGRLAAEVGLDPGEVASLLQGEMHAAAVRADEAEARRLGISGVPFFVIGRYGVSGAQPAEMLLQVLEKVWAEEGAAPQVFAEGATCGPDGC